MTNELKRYYELIQERPEEFLNSDILEIILDENIIEDFCKKNNKKIGVIYESKFHIFVVDLVKNKNNNIFTYERLLKTNSGGSVIVPMHGKKFVLLKQFRHALRDWQYAFPRGFRELGLSNFENAKKELIEELNGTASQFQYLGEVVADSGVSGNKVDVFLCNIETIEFNDTEGITGTIEVTEEELKKLIKDKKINDGFTLSAYAMFCALI